MILGQERRLGASLDWSRLRYTMDEVSAKAVRIGVQPPVSTTTWRTGPRRSSTGARAAGPSVSDLEVIPTPETGHALDGPLPPHRPGDRRACPDAVDHGRHDPARDDPRRHRRRGPSGRRHATPTLVGRLAPGSRSSIATCRSSPTRSSSRSSGPGRSRSRRPTTRTTTRPGSGTICRRSRSSTGPPRSTETGRPTPASTGSRRAPGSWPTSRLAATSSRREPHEMIIGRCQRSNDVIEPRLKTQWFIRTAPLAAPALEATRRAATRIVPDRFVKVWEHWLTEIRDWNVCRQLWWGHRIPAWYCPDGHISVTRRSGRSVGLRGRAAGRRPSSPGPRHLRHLVQLGAVAVLDPRLAGRHRRSAPVLPDDGDGDRLRHHLLLGRPDDDARDPAPRRGTVRDRLPLTAWSGTETGAEDEQDDGQRRRPARRVSTRSGRMRSASRSSTAPRRATTSGSAATSSRTRATSPTSCGTRRASSWAPGRHRSRPAPPGKRPTRRDSARPIAGCGPARRDDDRGERRRGDGRVRRGDRAPALRDDLERVLRLGPRAGQGPADRRAAPGRGSRGDLVDARRGARHATPPPPSVPAVPDRGDLGGDARTRRTIRSC